MSFVNTHHHTNVSTTDRAAGSHLNKSVYASGTETSVAARNQCDSSSRPDKAHLTPVDCSCRRGDVELCSVGDDVATCWLSSTSSSLLDASSLLSHEMHSKRTVDNGANPRQLVMLAPHASLVTPSVVL